MFFFFDACRRIKSCFFKVVPSITVGFICSWFWCSALVIHCNKNTLENISIEMSKLKFGINRFSFNLNKTLVAPLPIT